MTKKYTPQPVEKRRLIISVPTHSGNMPGLESAPPPSAPPPSAPLTEAEITKAMQSAGISLGIDNLVADLSKSMNVSIAHPMVPQRLLLQVLSATAGVWNFDGTSGANFYYGTNQVRLILRPVSNTIYLFDYSAVISAEGSFIYEISNSEGLNLEGEVLEIDGHALFAVKAPSAAELTIKIHKPTGGTWYFYNCQVIPQS